MIRKESKIKKWILPLFIAFIMVASVFGVIFGGFGGEEVNYYKYNGYLFRKEGDSWVGKVDGKVNGNEIRIAYGPKDLEGMNIDVDVDKIRSSEKVYLSLKPGENLLAGPSDLYNNLRWARPNLFIACPEDGVGCENLPIKDCEDAGQGIFVILMKAGNESVESESAGNVERKDNCVVVTGNGDYVTRVIDKIVLKYFGVM